MSRSKLWLKIALALIAIHVVVVLSVLVLRVPFGLERLSDTVVITTIYLPLVPWHLAELPILENTPQMLPPPNILGWAIIVLMWIVFYAAIGYLWYVPPMTFSVRANVGRDQQSSTYPTSRPRKT